MKHHPEHSSQEHSHSDTPSPEQILWRAVLDQAFQDIATHYRSEQGKRNALVWVYYNTRDFQTVCQMAGITPSVFRRAVLEYLFFRNLIQKGELTMDLNLQPRKKQTVNLEAVQKAKALFQALYSQHDLDKAIGQLTFQDCLNLCMHKLKKHQKPRTTTTDKE